MAPVYSKLLGRQLNTAAAVTVFTVPAGHVYVVRWISVYTTAAGQFMVASHVVGGAGQLIDVLPTGAAFNSINAERRWNFAAGDSLQSYSFVANVVYVSFYGFDLTN